MKLFCDQKDLSYALNIVNKAISPNNTLPVLNNISLKAENKKLHLSATNLELAISLFIDADVRNEGAITIPARLLTNYVALLKDDKIEMSIQEGLSLLLKTKESETKIKGINSDEFPLIPKTSIDFSNCSISRMPAPLSRNCLLLEATNPIVSMIFVFLFNL